MMPDKITITGELIYLNKENLNGRIYANNENLREQIEQFNNKGDRFGQIGFPDGDISITGTVSHSIRNVRIEDDKVMGEITILNTPHGEILKQLIDTVVFRPCSMGNINADHTVRIDKIISFSAVPKKEDPFDDDNYENFHPIIKYNRTYSEFDPYGEEDWDN
jgi:hypothetical protein